MLFQSSLVFPVKKRSAKKVSDKDAENCIPVSKPASVKRALFDRPQASISSKKNKIADENSTFGVSQANLVRQDASRQIARQVFHTGLPSRLIGREKEIDELSSFLNDHINSKRPGSMYISGAPGTGKTSSLMQVVKTIDRNFSYAFVNCMTCNNATSVFKTIASEFGLLSKTSNMKGVSKSLERFITTSKTMTLLILDEIDHLDTKGQETLYSIFEWPQLPNSTLVLIGIANALDLTDRVLPRLHAFKCQPKLMHFQPYTKDEISSILEDRLSDVQDGNNRVIQPLAIQLCARKIAACSGDIRKALDVCRRSIEVVENQSKRQFTLKQTSDDRCNPGSPMKRTLSPVKAVDLQEISQVLHDVYGSRLLTSNLSSNSEAVTLPLQQMVLMCTLILIKKNSKLDITLGKCYDVYKRVCKKRQLTQISECEFHSLCKLVELRGFIHLKQNKIARMTKVVLKIDEGEAEHVLQDKALLPAILSDKSVLCK